MAKMCYSCMMPTMEGGICKHCGQPELSAQSNGPKALPPGSTLGGGRITVGKKLGNGGFGVTYMAYDHKLNRRIALKEFLPGYMVEREGTNVVPKGGNQDAYVKAMNSFHKEARALYELRGHPNIVHVISAFRENNTAYYTMELLEGESLLSLLKRKKKISGEEAFKLLFPIMDAIRYIHRKGILHRDLSPDNIMFCKDPGNSGRTIPKLIDFGAAHVAIEGFSASYPGVKKNGFSPLEQNWAGKYQGSWTDVYALCATFYGAVVGAVPPAAVDRAEAKNSAARGEDPLKPARQMGGDISPEMDEVLMKGLALNYQERIQTMDELMVRMTKARNANTNVTYIDLPEPSGFSASRPVGRRIGAWLLDTLIFHGFSAALMVDAASRVRRGGLDQILGEQPLIWILPLVLLILNWILTATAKGTLGHLLTGLKVQKDDMSESPLGFGFCLLYAMLFPGLIGLICGLVYLASGKRVGPLEGICQGVVLRRGESSAPSLGSVMIDRSVSRPATRMQAVSSPMESTPASPAKNSSSGQTAMKVSGTAPAEQKTPAAKAVPRVSAPAKVPSPQPAAPPKPAPAPQSGVKGYLRVTAAAETMENMKGKVLTLQSGDTIGKSAAQAKVVLNDPGVSRLHCRFLYQESRGWIIKDEGSTNGTFVNDQRVPTGGMAPLKSGAKIQIGKEFFEFRT